MADDPLKEIQSLTEKVEVYKEKLEELGDVVNFLQADNNKLANSQGLLKLKQQNLVSCIREKHRHSGT